MPIPERNAPCPCGSGKKYKQCCIHQARPKPLVPLNKRQIVVTSQQKTPLTSAIPQPSKAAVSDDQTLTVASQNQPIKEEASSVPVAPTHPSYDSLMERVFGSACATNKAHLQAKEKGTSATLESAAEKDLTE